MINAIKIKSGTGGYREIDTLGGKDPYSASKSVSELVSESYMSSFFDKNSSAHIATARAGNVIGAGDWAEDRIVPDLFKAMKSNSILNIRNPNATRPWQHVLEPLSGYLELGSKLFREGKSFQGSWNFGPKNDTNYSVIDLINESKKYVKKIKISLENKVNKNFEAKYLKLDISKAINKLKWSPVLSFDETIKYTAQGYLSDLENKEYAFKDRLRTIRKYGERANELKLPWANSKKNG